MRENLNLNEEELNTLINLESVASKLSLNRKFTFYRGMGVQESFLEKLRKPEITLDGVISTSHDINTAYEYAENGKFHVIFIVTIAKNTNCIPIFLYAKRSEENEIAFLNLKLNIQKVFEKDDIIFVYANN